MTSVCFPLTGRSVGAALGDDSEDEAVDVERCHFQRKQRRKPRGRSQEAGAEPPIIRGLWVQEIDWLRSADREMTPPTDIIPPPPQFTDEVSCSCTDADDTSSYDQQADSDSESDPELDSESVHTHDSETDSYTVDDSQVAGGCGAALTFDLMNVSGFNSYTRAQRDSDSAGCVQSLPGTADSTHSASTVHTPECVCGCDDASDRDAVWALRGRVMCLPKSCLSPLSRDLIRQTLDDWKRSETLNEGLIFHHVRHLQLVSLWTLV